MQVKTIEKNIRAKMEEWLKTITDDKLRGDVKENLLVSGGSIASMLLNQPVNDYDVYLMDIDVVKRLAIYYTQSDRNIVIFDGREKEKLVKSLNDGYIDNGGDKRILGIDRNNAHAISLRNLKADQIKLYFNGEKGGLKVLNVDLEKAYYTPLYFSPNAISLSNQLQIVLRFHGTAEEIHKTFDFIHATNYFTFKEGLVRNLAAVESILTRQLKYQGSQYPVTSIIRAKKFIKRGFNIGAGELLKIMFQISNLDLNNPDVLEEQLVGVDVAYFDFLITALRNKMDSDEGFKLSESYFNSLIDRIFSAVDGEGDSDLTTTILPRTTAVYSILKLINWEKGDEEGNRKIFFQEYYDFTKELLQELEGGRHSCADDCCSAIGDVIDKWGISIENQVDDFPRIWINRPK